MPLARLLPLALLLSTLPLLAQRGDRPGEVQPGLPAHLEVPPAPILVAEEALKTLRVAPGFRLEIAAADPLVGDPVAMTFGPDGRIWVVEMRGFMPNADGQGEDAPLGTVTVLEDTDGDGRADKRTTFLDGLVMPRALALVGDGVLVAEPPHLWFARDTNGDGVADEKTEVFSAYGSTTNPEHTANGLMWALDNWIYNANHSQRFRYLGQGKFIAESTPARGQWGLSQDDTGRLFHNSNSDPLRADLVPTAYLRRNPRLVNAAGTNVRLAPAKLPIWPARVTPGVNRGYRTLSAEGKITAVTAACAPLVYRGALFPAEFFGNVFFAEPAGNLVKRLRLTETGGNVTAHNAYEGDEFLTSTDERFRPVNLAHGPDGALYLVDMYRGIIQHRIYLTSFLRQQIDARGLAEGIGMGRIYRIAPVTSGRSKAKFNLATETSAQLVARLRAANSWWRDTAQRLLVERRDPAAAPLLRELARSGPPLARLHALWTLDGSDQLDRDTVLAAIGNTPLIPRRRRGHPPLRKMAAPGRRRDPRPDHRPPVPRQRHAAGRVDRVAGRPFTRRNLRRRRPPGHGRPRRALRSSAVCRRRPRQRSGRPRAGIHRTPRPFRRARPRRARRHPRRQRRAQVRRRRAHHPVARPA